MKMRRVMLAAAAAVGAFAMAEAASAAPHCTSEPRSKWLTEVQMKAKIAQMGYQVKVFQGSGDCYEIYGKTKDGHRAEVYFNPVDGSIVRNNEDD